MALLLSYSFSEEWFFLSVLSIVTMEWPFSLIGCFNYPFICYSVVNLIIQSLNGSFSPWFSVIGTLFVDDTFISVSVLHTNIVVKINFVIFHVSY